MSKKATKQSRKTARRKAAQSARAREVALRRRAEAAGCWGVDRMSIEELERWSASYKSRPQFNPFAGAAMAMAAASMLDDIR